MPLIESPRHTQRDLKEWRRLEAYDVMLAGSAKLSRLETQARSAIAQFLAAGPCVAFVSWGKDSVVVAHMAVAHRVPLVWSRIEPFANPDCLLVRDAFLARYPEARYTEAQVECPGMSAGHGDECECLDRNLRQTIGTTYFASRHVSGVRAQESGVRRISIRSRGLVSKNACAPIGRWGAEHVFAYLHKHDLPIHPAYAMSFGGVLDRAKLRVDDIGGDRGRGLGRAEWEQRYYPEAVGRIAR